MSTTIAVTEWHTPTLEEFEAANPHLLNHSSRLVVDPEVDVSVNPSISSDNSSG